MPDWFISFGYLFSHVDSFGYYSVWCTHNSTGPFFRPCTVSTRPLGQNAASYVGGFKAWFELVWLFVSLVGLYLTHVVVDFVWLFFSLV